MLPPLPPPPPPPPSRQYTATCDVGSTRIEPDTAVRTLQVEWQMGNSRARRGPAAAAVRLLAPASSVSSTHLHVRPIKYLQLHAHNANSATQSLQPPEIQCQNLLCGITGFTHIMQQLLHMHTPSTDPLHDHQLQGHRKCSRACYESGQACACAHVPTRPRQCSHIHSSYFSVQSGGSK